MCSICNLQILLQPTASVEIGVWMWMWRMALVETGVRVVDGVKIGLRSDK